jgi:hemerythrin-like domain-containing protein
MIQTLPQVGHEHHERLLNHVNLLPDFADRLLTEKVADIRPEVDEVATFIQDILLPHVEAAERTLYPELERMYQNRHSMTPMRREHEQVRRLASEYAKLARQAETGRVSLGTKLALRRVIFQLYALLKIHVAEEEIYLRIVDHGVAADVADLIGAAMDHPGFRPA